MAFTDLEKEIKIPKGAGQRYRRLEALGRMLDGRLYSDMPYSFETEGLPGKKHIPLRERRPSVIFNLAYEITQDTCAELFGDEQFPILNVISNRVPDEEGTTELSSLLDMVGLPDVMVEVYEEGVIGSVGVVIHRSDNGLPYYIRSTVQTIRTS